jgi:hypothetical protein
MFTFSAKELASRNRIMDPKPISFGSITFGPFSSRQWKFLPDQPISMRPDGTESAPYLTEFVISVNDKGEVARFLRAQDEVATRQIDPVFKAAHLPSTICLKLMPLASVLQITLSVSARCLNSPENALSDLLLVRGALASDAVGDDRLDHGKQVLAAVMKLPEQELALIELLEQPFDGNVHAHGQCNPAGRIECVEHPRQGAEA